MKKPASGTLLVFGFVLVAIGAIALNLIVNQGEGSLRPANDPPKAPQPLSASPASSTTSPESSRTWPHTIAGDVTANGRPFEGARVTALPLDWSRGAPAPEGSSFATSGKDGRFELEGIPEEPFRIWAESDGWLPGVAIIASTGKGTRPRIEGVSLRLLPAGRIDGRITSAEGIAVSGAALFVGDESGSVDQSLEAMATSGIDGTYSLTPVRPGRMTVASFDARLGFAIAVVGVREAELARVDLTLRPLGRVTGRIVSSDGEPLAGARIVAVDPGDLDLVPPTDGASRRLLTVAGRMQTTHSDLDGHFEFRTILSRSASLAIRLDGYAPASRRIEIPAQGEAPSLEIRLKADNR